VWDNISDKTIIQSFKKCGITNSLNELENGDIDEIIDKIVDKETRKF